MPTAYSFGAFGNIRARFVTTFHTIRAPRIKLQERLLVKIFVVGKQIVNKVLSAENSAMVISRR